MSANCRQIVWACLTILWDCHFVWPFCEITGPLPGKLKRKYFCPLSYKILPPAPPEITKTWKITVLEVLWGPGNQCGTQWFFMILWIFESFSLYLLVKNNFNFRLGLFTYFEYISGCIIKFLWIPHCGSKPLEKFIFMG